MHVGGAFAGAPQATLPMGKRCCKEGLVGASNWATAGLTGRDLSIGPVFWSGLCWRRWGSCLAAWLAGLLVEGTL